MELNLAQSLCILKVIFRMIYLSFLIYPYAVHSPVPHSLIQSPYWRAYTDGSRDDKPFFNHLAQCLSLFKPFTTMHIQCLPRPPCLLFQPYVFKLPAWWAVRLLWWPLTECSNASMCFPISTMYFCYCFIVVFYWKWNLQLLLLLLLLCIW